jgi:hypothetical protein
MLVWLGRCGQPGRTGDILSLSDMEVKVHRVSERSLRSGVQVRIAGRTSMRAQQIPIPPTDPPVPFPADPIPGPDPDPDPTGPSEPTQPTRPPLH